MEGIRITVLKRLEVPDVAADYAADGRWEKCWLEEGQIFEVEGGSDFPKPLCSEDSEHAGFCSWAWRDIQRDVTLLRYGADAPWMRHKGTMISSCTDGRKPVVFLIERIKDRPLDALERIGEPESPPRAEQGTFPNARITCVKRFANIDLIREYATGGENPERQAPCSFCTEGDSFVSVGMTKPEGFCSWAWADIQRDVVWVCLGGVQAKHKTPGTAIACCTDGLNPVVFHIERIEEEDG